MGVLDSFQVLSFVLKSWLRNLQRYLIFYMVKSDNHVLCYSFIFISTPKSDRLAPKVYFFIVNFIVALFIFNSSNQWFIFSHLGDGVTAPLQFGLLPGNKGPRAKCQSLSQWNGEEGWRVETLVLLFQFFCFLALIRTFEGNCKIEGIVAGVFVKNIPSVPS